MLAETVAAIIKRGDRYLIIEEHTADGIKLNQPGGPHRIRGNAGAGRSTGIDGGSLRFDSPDPHHQLPTPKRTLHRP